MRNVFDQYLNPENRLTHALVSALSEDHRLLRRFVRWVTNARVMKTKSLTIVEQGLPGEHIYSEEQAEKRGLPDACIHDGEEWALLIESKVAAALNGEQLRRHHRTAARRGLKKVMLLVLDTELPTRKLPSGTIARKWSDLYKWLVAEEATSKWAKLASEYFVIAENRMVEEEYLREGTLTTFAGIPFNTNNPYNYPEAKRLLILALEELRRKKELIKILGMDPTLPGRGAITGKKDASAVWDFLRLKISRGSGVFTKYPHLTLAIQAERLVVIVTVPHGIKTQYRRNLTHLGYDGFERILSKVNSNLLRALKNAKGSSPWVDVVQRRFASQRSTALVDARVEFDLRTAIPGRIKSKVKLQPQWLKAGYDALCNKKSNLQFAVGAVFPYHTCPATKSKKIIDHIADVWISCKPLIDAMLGNRRF